MPLAFTAPPPPTAPIIEIKPNGTKGVVIRIHPDTSGVDRTGRKWQKSVKDEAGEEHHASYRVRLTAVKGGDEARIDVEHRLDDAAIKRIQEADDATPRKVVEIVVDRDADGNPLPDVSGRSVRQLEIVGSLFYGKDDAPLAEVNRVLSQLKVGL